MRRRLGVGLGRWGVIVDGADPLLDAGAFVVADEAVFVGDDLHPATEQP